MPAADQDALRAEAATVIRDIVAPAYARLLTMIREEYLVKARTTLAARAMPDGEAFYQAQIEKHTTLTLTPQQIHDIGLKEVARIEAEMRATKDKANFKGTMAEFFTFLRTDPQFYAKTPRELLSYSAYVAKKADDKLAETIGFLPRRRHGIRPVPDALAPIYTGGRGGLEACLMNTYNLPARPLYTLASLTLHECTPGHSFQAALALEGPERPAVPSRHVVLRIRRRLGTLHGMAGHRDGDLRNAVRGLRPADVRDVARVPAGHRHRHSSVRLDARAGDELPARSRARWPSTRSPPRSIATSRGRDRRWPTSLANCRSVVIAVRPKRSSARRFDQRRFHDAILAIGSVPLPVLEQRMAQFIADESATPKD